MTMTTATTTNSKTCTTTTACHRLPVLNNLRVCARCILRVMTRKFVRVHFLSHTEVPPHLVFGALLNSTFLAVLGSSVFVRLCVLVPGKHLKTLVVGNYFKPFFLCPIIPVRYFL